MANNYGRTCWYKDEKCPCCDSQMITNGDDGWCSRCNYACRYVWVGETEHREEKKKHDG